MTEYIERGALVAWIEKQKRLSKLLTIMAIQETPAADVVEVVRCKDCIGKTAWYKNAIGCNICGLSGMFVVEDNDFCSYGERRKET